MDKFQNVNHDLDNAKAEAKHDLESKILYEYSIISRIRAMSSEEIKGIKNVFLYHLYDSNIEGKEYDKMLEYGKAHGLSREVYDDTVRQDAIKDFEIIDSLNVGEFKKFLLDPQKYLTSLRNSFNVRGFITNGMVGVSQGYSVTDRYEEYVNMYKLKYGEKSFEILMNSAYQSIELEQLKAANHGKEKNSFQSFNIEGLLSKIEELKNKEL